MIPRKKLAVRPCREDGLDRNITHLNEVDYLHGIGHKGLIEPCEFEWCKICSGRRKRSESES